MKQDAGGPSAFSIAPMTLEDIPHVMEIEMQSFPTPWSESSFRFELQAAGRVAVSAEQLTDRVLSLTGPVYSRSALVARQLPDLARDRLFESSVALARTMAEAVL